MAGPVEGDIRRWREFHRHDTTPVGGNRNSFMRLSATRP